MDNAVCKKIQDTNTLILSKKKSLKIEEIAKAYVHTLNCPECRKHLLTLSKELKRREDKTDSINSLV